MTELEVMEGNLPKDLSEYRVFVTEGRQRLKPSLLQMHSALNYCDFQFVRHKSLEVQLYRKWPPERTSTITNWCASLRPTVILTGEKT